MKLHAGLHRGREGERQIGAAQFDFEHGDETHVAILRARIRSTLRRRHGIGEGGVVARLPLDLALLVAARPIEDVQHIRQVLRINRAQLEIRHDGVVTRRPGFEREVARLPLEGIRAAEGRRLPHHGERR